MNKPNKFIKFFLWHVQVHHTKCSQGACKWAPLTLFPRNGRFPSQLPSRECTIPLPLPDLFRTPWLRRSSSLYPTQSAIIHHQIQIWNQEENGESIAQNGSPARPGEDLDDKDNPADQAEWIERCRWRMGENGEQKRRGVSRVSTPLFRDGRGAILRRALEILE